MDGGQYQCPECGRTIHLNVVKMVHSVSCTFYPSIKLQKSTSINHLPGAQAGSHPPGSTLLTPSLSQPATSTAWSWPEELKLLSPAGEPEAGCRRGSGPCLPAPPPHTSPQEASGQREQRSWVNLPPKGGKRNSGFRIEPELTLRGQRSVVFKNQKQSLELAEVLCGGREGFVTLKRSYIEQEGR